MGRSAKTFRRNLLSPHHIGEGPGVECETLNAQGGKPEGPERAASKKKVAALELQGVEPESTERGPKG